MPSSGLPQPQIAQFFQGSLVLLIHYFQSMEDGRDAAGMGGSVNGAVSGGAASGSAATTSSAGGAAAAAAAAALVLATEDQGCPAGWQANPSTKGGKWVIPERAMEMMQDVKRRGRADY